MDKRIKITTFVDEGRTFTSFTLDEGYTPTLAERTEMLIQGIREIRREMKLGKGTSIFDDVTPEKAKKHVAAVRLVCPFLACQLELMYDVWFERFESKTC